MKRMLLVVLSLALSYGVMLGQRVSQTSSGKNSPNIANVNGDLNINQEHVTPKTKAAAIPVITVDLREKFFKAQSEYQAAAAVLTQATQAAQAKNISLQEQVDKLKTACGAEHIPNVDKDGEIVCTEKPKAPEPEKK